MSLVALLLIGCSGLEPGLPLNMTLLNTEGSGELYFGDEEKQEGRYVVELEAEVYGVDYEYDGNYAVTDKNTVDVKVPKPTFISLIPNEYKGIFSQWELKLNAYVGENEDLALTENCGHTHINEMIDECRDMGYNCFIGRSEEYDQTMPLFPESVVDELVEDYCWW